MAECKACGEWFGSSKEVELCPACEKALNRLGSYVVPATDRLADILKADREGRLVIKAPPLEETCGTCEHFQREPGTAHGECDCRMKGDRYKKSSGRKLQVTQGRKRCRPDYVKRTEEEST